MVSYNEPENEILTGLLFCMGLSMALFSLLSYGEAILGLRSLLDVATVTPKHNSYTTLELIIIHKLM